MSSFANQGGQLRGSLIEAGLPAAAATIIANIFANSVQTMRHDGQLVHDTTPSGLRQVTPESRTHTLTNLDFREGDPDYRRQSSQDSEDRPRPIPNSTVVESRSPQESTSSLSRVAGGAFTDITPSGDSSTVTLRIKGSGNFPVLDYATNSIIAKSFRAESDGFVRLQIEERPNEVVFRASTNTGSGAMKPIDVLTDLRFTGNYLVATRSTILVPVLDDAAPASVPVVECPT